jgi:hypothetical protein
MKADLRISIKDDRRNKRLKVLLFRTPWPRQFFVRMNGERWPKGKGTASLSRVFAALRKGVVRGSAGGS